MYRRLLTALLTASERERTRWLRTAFALEILVLVVAFLLWRVFWG